MKFAYFDPSFSGISGDMMLGALLGLTNGEEKILRVADYIKEELGCTLDVSFERKKDAYSSIAIESIIEGGRKYDLKKTIPVLAHKFGLEKTATSFCCSVAGSLVEAEQAVHKSTAVELHELGSPDTLLDILGVAALGEDLGFFEDVGVYSAPIKVGGGYVGSAHGRLPVPAPVTLEILKKYNAPFFIEGEGELATPTGVALLVNLAKFTSMPPARVIDYGAGSGTFKEREDNVLRVIMCEESKLPKGIVSILETSVDDVSGEVLGYTLERLYAEGALDVQIVPSITKKNRPGHVVKVICDVGLEGAMADILFSETGTLGIRVSTEQKRFQIERELKEVEVSLPGYDGKAKVKVARHDGAVISLKAEYEDARRIAEATSLPLRNVLKEIEEQARHLL
jgi:hypothetical protein